MMASWPCPAPDGGTAMEHGFALDRGRALRLLVVPALFDEGNRLRRQTVEVMRRLDDLGLDTILIDLPGCNESLVPLGAVSLAHWQAAVIAGVGHFAATHVLAWRAGAVAVPTGLGLPFLGYAPVSGASALRQMVRMRALSAREAGREETAGEIMEAARRDGTVLAGYPLSAAMVCALETAQPAPDVTISQADIGGAGLWLRAEAGEDPAQARALAERIARECGA